MNTFWSREKGEGTWHAVRLGKAVMILVKLNKPATASHDVASVDSGLFAAAAAAVCVRVRQARQ